MDGSTRANGVNGWSRRGVLGSAAAGLVAACATPGDTGATVNTEAAAPGYSTLYYLGQAKVFSLSASGGAAPVTLVDHTVENQYRRGVNDGIALDLARGHIYWTNMGRAADRDGFIFRSNLDGSHIVEIVPPGGTHTPKQLKLDAAGGKLYWSDREGMAIMRCNLDGSNIETLIATGDPAAHRDQQARWCVGMALDPVRGHIYWTQKGGDNAYEGLIRRAPMEKPRGQSAAARNDIVTLFARLPEPIDLDLDLASRTIYWTDRGDNTVSRAPMDPERGFDPAKRVDRQILVSGLKEAIGIALDLRNGRMAYTSLGGEVGMARLDGSQAQMLATDQGLLTGIAWG